jgi:hypothetical protein
MPRELSREDIGFARDTIWETPIPTSRSTTMTNYYAG